MGQYRSTIDDAVTDNAVSVTANTLTLAVSHVGKTIYADGSGAQTYTTPASTDTTIAVGSKIKVVRNANQTLTVAGGSGVTVNNPGSALTARARYSEIILTKTSSTTWRLGGDMTVA